MKTKRQLLSLLLVLSVLLGTVPSAYASSITAPGNATSQAVLNTEELIMDVTVPTSVLIHVDAEGTVTTPDTIPVVNNSVAPVFVHSLAVNTLNDWTLDPINNDYTGFKTNQKHYWLSFNGLDPSSKPIALATPISGSDSLNLVLSAGVAPQRTAINALNIGEIVITLDWDAAEGAEEGNPAQGFGFSVEGASYTAPKTFTFNLNTTETGTYIAALIPPNETPPPFPSPGLAPVQEHITVTSTGSQEQTVLFASADESMTDADIYIWRMNDEGDFLGPVKTTVREEVEEEGFAIDMVSYVGGDIGIKYLPKVLGNFDVKVVAKVSGETVKTSNRRVDTLVGNTHYIPLDGSFDKSIDYEVIITLTGDDGKTYGPVTTVLSAEESTGGTGSEFIPEGYTLATDDDFSGEADGMFKYIGTSDYVVIPHVIKGVPVTSYKSMFEFTSVKGVASDNPNVTIMSSMFYNSAATSLDLSSFDTSSVTDMSQMFVNSAATSLDLSSFDTSSVTDMSQMFVNSKATSLDLSSFDTSNVTNMSQMFSYSKATSLDLSSFDTSSVTDMSQMFWGSAATSLDLSSFNTTSVTGMYKMFTESAATTGYARTIEDADKFNASSEKPAELTFVVK